MSENVSNSSVPAQLIDLDDVAAWPREVLDYLSVHLALFHDWAVGPTTYGATEYDRAVYELARLLRPYALKAWHCTRLTDHEAMLIERDGMVPPEPARFLKRIDTAVAQGFLSEADGKRLKDKNQTSEANRRGRIWFCFYPPIHSGEGGIRSLLGTWGGEALYNSHDRDPEMGPKLRSVGTPSLVEAVIPISMLGDGVRAAFTVIARHLAHHGLESRDHLNFEDRVTSSLGPELVQRVIRFPSEDFVRLTGADQWREPFS